MLTVLYRGVDIVSGSFVHILTDPGFETIIMHKIVYMVVTENNFCAKGGGNRPPSLDLSLICVQESHSPLYYRFQSFVPKLILRL